MKIDRRAVAFYVLAAAVLPFVAPLALLCAFCIILPLSLLRGPFEWLKARRKPKPAPPVIQDPRLYGWREQEAFLLDGWEGVRKERLKRLGRYPGGSKAEAVSVIQEFHRLSRGGEL